MATAVTRTGMSSHGTSNSGNNFQRSNLGFPVKLHACLTELERQGLSHIASFQPHGRSFLVHKQHEFVTQVLPNWFNQTKYSSFQRQLNLYGFQRITEGPDKHGYYHALFVRGQATFVDRIRRVGIKGNGPRRAASAESTPNFYAVDRSGASADTGDSIDQAATLAVPATSVRASIINVPMSREDPFHGVGNRPGLMTAETREPTRELLLRALMAQQQRSRDRQVAERDLAARILLTAVSPQIPTAILQPDAASLRQSRERVLRQQAAIQEQLGTLATMEDVTAALDTLRRERLAQELGARIANEHQERHLTREAALLRLMRNHDSLPVRGAGHDGVFGRLTM